MFHFHHGGNGGGLVFWLVVLGVALVVALRDRRPL